MVAIKLMPHESSVFVMGFPPSTPMSIYVKNTDEDLDLAVSFVTNRFREILKANPWLCGRLVNEKHDGKTDKYLLYEEDISSIDEYFSVKADDKVFEITDPISLMDYLAPQVPKNGLECIDKDEKLCQLLVFRNTELSKLALMFTLNHVVGDGETCYSLWKMLDKEQSVKSMVIERYYDMYEAVEQQTNLPPLPEGYSISIIKIVLSMLGRGLKRTIYNDTPRNRFVYRVKADEIVKRKSELNTKDSFVSTNDIICTIFGLCNPSDGLNMIVNMRDKISELGGDRAGNYVMLCPVSFTGIKTPKDFRDRWTGIVSKEIPADTVNGAGYRVTNWSNLYHQVELPGLHHRIHLPITPNDIATHFLGIPLAVKCFMVPFRLHDHELGVLLTVYDDIITEEYLEGCEILGGKVSL